VVEGIALGGHAVGGGHRAQSNLSPIEAAFLVFAPTATGA
jgi:hypothetical protein